MSDLVSSDEQLKILLNPELRERLDRIFERQGVTLREGLTRLIQFMVDQPEEVHPVILNQAPGASASAITEAVLQRMTKARVVTIKKRKTNSSKATGATT